jgi:hypothetical protein
LDRADIYSMLILWPALVVRGRVAVARRGRSGLRPRRSRRDPDEAGVPPAVCGYLLRGCRQADEDFTATLLDLVDRGVVEVSPQPGDADDQLLTLHAERLRQVWPHEDALLRLLFEVAGEHEAVTLRQFDRFARERRREYERGLEDVPPRVRRVDDRAAERAARPLHDPRQLRDPDRPRVGRACTRWRGRHVLYLLSGCALAALMLVHAGVMFQGSR